MKFAVELLKIVHSAVLCGILLWYIGTLPDDGERLVIAVILSIGCTLMAIIAYFLLWLFIGRRNIP